MGGHKLFVIFFSISKKIYKHFVLVLLLYVAKTVYAKKLKTLRSAETAGFDILDARKYISKENF
jgi:hypothetical protein